MYICKCLSHLVPNYRYLKSRTFTGFLRCVSALQGPHTPHPTDSKGSPSTTPVCLMWQSQVTAHPCGYTKAAEKCSIFKQFKEWMCFSKVKKVGNFQRLQMMNETSKGYKQRLLLCRKVWTAFMWWTLMAWVVSHLRVDSCLGEHFRWPGF